MVHEIDEDYDHRKSPHDESSPFGHAGVSRINTLRNSRQQLPTWFRKLELIVLMRAFGRAFGVETPGFRGLSVEESLLIYREFTASCIELALQDKRLAEYLRKRLGSEALALGKKLKLLTVLPKGDAASLASLLYQGIGIGFTAETRDTFRFCPCFFAGRYTSDDCLFMSAFDKGFLRGIFGRTEAKLIFSCRLTQGASCCLASFFEAL